MINLKLRLKRKRSGKAIKALKRLETYSHINHRNTTNFLWCPKTRQRKPTLYELEGTVVLDRFHRTSYALELKKEYKRSGNKHKLKRLYKIFPEITPEAIAKKISYQRTLDYKARCSNQNLK